MVGSILPVVSHEDPHRRIVEEAIEAVLSTVDLASVLDRTGQLLRRHFGVTRVAINRISPTDPTRAEVVLVSDPRQPSPELGTSFPLAGSAAGKALGERTPCVVDPLQPKSPRYREEPLLAAYGYGSLVSFPLVFENEVLGTLDIAHPPAEGLLDCCFEVAKQVAHLVAIALHNSLMVEEVQRLNRLLGRENALLKEEIRQIKRDARYVAESPGMKDVVERVRLVSPSTTTVLIRGETGVGKEGLARMVHEFSPRFNAPFVPVNLGAIPEGLIESELFGHEKGAFTGASRRRPGRFEQADGGTIFLDEVGDAPPSVQVRLLRVLQERVVERVGGTEPVKVDVRVVAATNRNLEEMVARGTFRADLYYRLAVFPIELPPLRERRDEIRPLAMHFLARHAAGMHRRPPRVAEDVWRALEAHDWPGNVRELENFLQRALILSPGPELSLPDLPVRLTQDGAPAAAPDAAAPGTFEEEVRALIERALSHAGGRVYGPGGAASLLGLRPTTLQGKMKKYGVAPTRARP
ncbi:MULTISPECIES: sigma-54-dependent Fis family transcriptional regulator [Anaeromyxobacter]|uniref:sigma-54-dependent Fis family transcriptional regulator n=1 Tax=Anaeromyxobacter TaxID=161492 RepID=UPI001F56993D|nr:MULTISPECIES: sigma-54-dependent Fis family transcriptional regulator [unclassified Anaeromyxobacter]